MTDLKNPIEIDDATFTFPGNVKHLMPNQKDIPGEFKDRNNKFVKLQSKWFFRGLKGNELIIKKGINRRIAFRHLSAIQGSLEPKHEHKESAVAYLMSLWFDLT